MGIIPSWYQVSTYVRTFATGIGIRLYGATSGFVGLKPPASPDSTEYTLPASAPTVNGQAMVATTGGVMSWATIGVQGAQGVQGIQGFQGSQGWQGAVGTGTQGLQGFQGWQGAIGTGTQGFQGAQGSAGSAGLQGLQGAQGWQGAVGAGVQGNQGWQGLQGPQGWQGPVGDTGATGATGSTGATGLQGYQGFQGAQGFQGNQGWQGNVGTTGLQGNQGFQGNQGWQGSSGAGSSQWESTGGVFQIKTTEIASGDQVKIVSRESDGATQVAHILDTENTFSTSGGKTFLVRNNGTEQVYIDHAGDLTVLGTGTGTSANSKIYLQGIIIDNQGSSANVYGLRVRYSGTLGGTHYEAFRATYGIVSVADVGSVGDSAFKVKARSSAYAYTNSGYFLDATQYYDGDSYLNKSATTDGEMRWYYDGVKSLAWSDKTTTTDNTITTIINETISDNTVHVIEALVVGRRTDAAGRWSGRRRFTVYRAGGGATVEGAVETLGTDVANGLTPTITCDANSNDWRVRVTSENSKTVAWRVYIEKVHA